MAIASAASAMLIITTTLPTSPSSSSTLALNILCKPAFPRKLPTGRRLFTSHPRLGAAAKDIAYSISVESPLTTNWPNKLAMGAPSVFEQAAAVDGDVVQVAAQRIQGWVYEIKRMFQSMSLGEISVSAYDTAWVAMVPSLSGSNIPQFPKTLDWIIENQLPDGSWGDKQLFLPYDRLCSTTACVLALKTWNIGHENIQRGVQFIHENINNINLDEADDNMPIAFEVVFPTMLEDAKVLGINLPYDSPVALEMRKRREDKLNRMSMEKLHTVPTPQLFSLEGLHRLVDWERILKLQSNDGSFLFSPASTACALKYTHDIKCLNYLNLVLERFNNTVPNIYPVDVFERLWMVDRLERLGISRYFKKEINECLDYVYKYWTQRGISWARETNVFDADDTAMGFRLLRLHGYSVSPEVFQQFKNNNEFFPFEGQANKAVTSMYNLYQASQIKLPNETILDEINCFSKSFLIDRQREDQTQDKVVISKGFESEVAYALKFSWYQSLPRIEARGYIECYGVDDAWIGKALYRMFNINNKVFLELAKADYNLCQSFHQRELEELLKWSQECQFSKLGFARKRVKEYFLLVATTLFEPKYSLARILFTMCNVMGTIIDDFFDNKGSMEELSSFLHAVKCWDPKKAQGFSQEMNIIFFGLYHTMDKIYQELFKAQGWDVSIYWRDIWVKFLNSLYIEAKWKSFTECPTLEEYMRNAKISTAAEVMRPMILFLDEEISEEDLRHENISQIMDQIATIERLNNDTQDIKKDIDEGKLSAVSIFLKENPKATTLEAVQYFRAKCKDSMEVLLQEHLRDTIISQQCKQLYLNMARMSNFCTTTVEKGTSILEISQYVEATICTPIT